MKVRLEELLTSPKGFGLSTATPVQRAMCRAIDGEPLAELWDLPEVRGAFGGAAPVPGRAPREVVILAAVRCGKSLMVSAKSCAASLTVPLDVAGPGDIPRVSVLSLRKDNAKQTFSHLVGRMKASNTLRRFVAKKPTAELLTIRRPDKRLIEVMVTAGQKAGGSLVSRWQATCIFDEAARMNGQDEGVINLDDSLTAVRGRVLDGGQILCPTSPWAPMGPVYKMFQDNWGKPDAEVLCMRGRGPDMNPTWWTPERCEDLKRRDPLAYQTDVEAEFADPPNSYYTAAELERCQRTERLPHVPYEEFHYYTATMDPATRTNAWTLVVTTCTGMAGDRRRIQVVYKRQWMPTEAERLDSRKVLQEIAEDLRRYKLDTVYSDQWSGDVLSDLARDYGLAVIVSQTPPGESGDLHRELHALVESGLLELPADDEMKSDMQRVKRILTQNGMRYELPVTADGRHCDYVPPLLLAVKHQPLPPRDPPKAEDMLAAARKRQEQRRNNPIGSLVSRRRGYG